MTRPEDQIAELKWQLAAARAAERAKRAAEHAARRAERNAARADRDQEIARLYASGKTLLECAHAVGFSSQSVWQALERLGIPRRHQGTQIVDNSEREARFIEKRERGMRYVEIAQEESPPITGERVRQILKRVRPELCGRFYVPPPTCHTCGTVLNRGSSGRCRKCSADVQSSHFFKVYGAKWEAMVDAMIAARRTGKSWREAWKAAGQPDRLWRAAETRFLRRLKQLARHGISKDTTGVFGHYAGDAERVRRKAA